MNFVETNNHSAFSSSGSASHKTLNRISSRSAPSGTTLTSLEPRKTQSFIRLESVVGNHFPVLISPFIKSQPLFHSFSSTAVFLPNTSISWLQFTTSIVCIYSFTRFAVRFMYFLVIFIRNFKRQFIHFSRCDPFSLWFSDFELTSIFISEVFHCFFHSLGLL